MFKLLFKRVFDLVVSVIGLILFLPILIICALCIKFVSKTPIFFQQPRPGLNEKIFYIIKFQTMVPQKEGESLADAQRLTRVGKFLRKYSLDELPQLINVIKGDLSLVGPRPLLVEYLELYDEEQKKRHKVKPGITGWAQVNGRNAISWEQKFSYDVWYVENWSLWLDFKILLLTALKVIKGSDVSAKDHATVEKFQGKK